MTDEMLSYERQYWALTEQAGVVDFAKRTRIEVSGDDRASFLHNLSTNDVRGLSPGHGGEAFFLDARGHVLAHVFLICRPTSIVIETVGGQNDRLMKHLDRYLIREKVDLADRTAQWGELLVSGPGSQQALMNLTTEVPVDRLASLEATIGGEPVTVVRVEITCAGGYLLFCEAGAQQAIADALAKAGAVPCPAESLEAPRIEAGFPWYGPDISDKNLPQEVNRDELAICFKKGCYIGQETVARIDALGHVNRKLVRIQFADGRVPSPGAELRSGDQTAGEVTSAAYSPRHGAAVALAYLRRGSDAPQTKLTSDFGPATVMST